MSDSGSEPNELTTTTNGLKSKDFSPSEKVAAIAYQSVREMFPLPKDAPKESDHAVRLRIELLAMIVDEIGPDAFWAATKKALSYCRGRFDYTPLKVREAAGLYWQQPLSPAAKAWHFVGEVFVNHVRTDGNGNYRLEDKVVNVNGVARIFHTPPIPPAIAKTIRAMGGWASLAMSYPDFWTARYREFKELYSED